MPQQTNYEINSLKLQSLFSGNVQEIRLGMEELIVYENIFHNLLSGTLSFYETESFRETFPIIGEEILVVDFVSYSHPDRIRGEAFSYTFDVIGIKEFELGGTDRQRHYTIQFASRFAEKSATKRVRKVYEGKHSNIVTILTGSSLGGWLENTDSTKTEGKYIFPNISPLKAINQMTRQCISEKYNDPYYFFYESRYGFNFVSMSYLMDQGPSHTFKESMGLNSGLDNYNVIDTIETNKMSNRHEMHMSGMLGNTVVRYNKQQKKYDELTYTYDDVYGQFKHVGETKMAKAIAQSPKNRMQFIVSNEPKYEGVYSYTEDHSGQLLIRSAQARQNAMTIRLSGNSGIQAGQTCNFNMKNSKNSMDQMLSGKFLITKVKHSISPVGYKQYVEITKDGYIS